MNGDGVQTLLSKSEFTEIAEELSLSPRESQIIREILSGHSDKQIAKNLEMAMPTLRTHLQRLFSKLEIGGKQELILRVFSAFRKISYEKECLQKLTASKQMTS